MAEKEEQEAEEEEEIQIRYIGIELRREGVTAPSRKRRSNILRKIYIYVCTYVCMTMTIYIGMYCMCMCLRNLCITSAFARCLCSAHKMGEIGQN